MKKFLIILIYLLLFTFYINSLDKNQGLLIIKIETNSIGWEYQLEQYPKPSIKSYWINELKNILYKDKENNSGYYAVIIPANKKLYFGAVVRMTTYARIDGYKNKIFEVNKDEIVWGGIINTSFEMPRLGYRINYKFEEGNNDDFKEALLYLIEKNKDEKWTNKAKMLLESLK